MWKYFINQGEIFKELFNSMLHTATFSGRVTPNL